MSSRICIVGAGVVGLSIAYELVSRGYKDIVIVEKEPEIGRHASGRNSGVLHAGIYYKSDTLKAEFCIEGNRQWKAFCKQHQLPILDTGKVLVAKTTEEVHTLERLYTQAQDNGANVSMVSASQVSDYEPMAKTVDSALVSHDTAIVNPKLCLSRLQALLEDSGAVTFKFHQKATRIDGQVLFVGNESIPFDFLINAAGAHSDQLAYQCGVPKTYQLVPFKGIYRKLCPKKAPMIKGNIYPVPDLRNPFLGVHFTTSINGDVYIGPTAIPAFGAENYKWFENLGRHSLKIAWQDLILLLTNPKFRSVAITEPKYYLDSFFYKEAAKLVHGLEPTDLLPATKSGIRPQLVNWTTKELVMDFVIEKSPQGIHILNAISPAFTCAPSFSRYLVDTYLK